MILYGRPNVGAWEKMAQFCQAKLGSHTWVGTPCKGPIAECGYMDVHLVSMLERWLMLFGRKKLGL